MRKTSKKCESGQDQFLLNKRFSDFDYFAHMIRAWDLDFCQLDRGRFRAELLQVGINTSLITHARFNRNLDQHGSPPPGLWTFALLTEQSSPLLWRGREVSTNTLLIYHPGSEIDAVSKQGFDVFTLSFSETSLNNAARILGLPDIADLIGDSDSTPVDFLKMGELGHLLLSLIHEVKENPSSPVQNILTGKLENELLNYLLQCLASSRCIKDKSSYRKRDRALKQIRDYMKICPDEHLTVQGLCRVTDVSIRTLEYVFLERFGVSPKKYLKAHCLNGVRRELCRTHAGVTRISDVANRWGFWHMGQFAADYCRLFGELPSETQVKYKSAK